MLISHVLCRQVRFVAETGRRENRSSEWEKFSSRRRAGGENLPFIQDCFFSAGFRRRAGQVPNFGFFRCQKSFET